MSFDDEMDGAMTRLCDDYEDRFVPGSILQTFVRAVRELRAVGVDAGLVVAAEAMTRRRLELWFVPAEASREACAS